MSKHVNEVTDSSFEKDVLQSGLPVLVDFWAEWCGPCRMLTPVVEAVAERFQGVVQVVKVNVDDNVSVSQRFGIKGIPTLVLFKNGKEAERIVGAASQKTIAEMINRNLNCPVAA